MKEGDKFRSFEELERKLADHKLQTCTEFWKRDARTLQQAAKTTPRARSCNQELKYYFLKYSCIHGGQKLKPKKNESGRKTFSFKGGCGAFLFFFLSADGDTLYLKKVNAEHNHPIDNSKTFKHLPQQRKINVVDKGNAKKFTKMRAKRQLIVEAKEVILLKDLSNTLRKNELPESDIIINVQSCVLLLESKYGCHVEVLASQDTDFKALFFQDKSMRESYEAFPEVLFFDGSYKLLQICASVYVFVVVDSAGNSEIVATGILYTDDKESIEWLLSTFKSQNKNWKCTSIIMTDKDTNEIDVLGQHFPNTNVLICKFHVTQIFKHEITCRKCGITPSEEELTKEYLLKILNARSEKHYDDLYEEMQKTLPLHVLEYYNENWHGIRAQWVYSFIEKKGHFLSDSNNSVESVNRRLKTFIRKISSLQKFCTDFFIELSLQRAERDHNAIKMIHKVPVHNYELDSPIVKYMAHLTSYAFSLVENQLNHVHEYPVESKDGILVLQSSSGELNVTSMSCTCAFFTSMSLPCRHVFFVRQHLTLDLFEPSLCLKRWTRQFYMCSQRALKPIASQTAVRAESVIEEMDPNYTLTPNKKHVPTLTSAQKYRKMRRQGARLATLGSEVGDREYYERAAFLNTVINAWERGKKVALVEQGPAGD